VITGRFPDDPDGGEDDLLTAELIERARTGQPLEAAATAHAVARSDEAERTLAVGDGHVHLDDIAYATAVDRFDFAMEAEHVDGPIRLLRRDSG
jgi:phosphosulfolactate phosphohydrolase-like enzyme